MTSSFPSPTNSHLPTAWLAPPEALLPSSSHFHADVNPISLAISCIFATLAIISTILLFSKKNKGSYIDDTAVEEAIPPKTRFTAALPYLPRHRRTSPQSGLSPVYESHSSSTPHPHPHTHSNPHPPTALPNPNFPSRYQTPDTNHHHHNTHNNNQIPKSPPPPRISDDNNNINNHNNKIINNNNTNTNNTDTDKTSSYTLDSNSTLNSEALYAEYRETGIMPRETGYGHGRRPGFHSGSVDEYEASFVASEFVPLEPEAVGLHGRVWRGV
ncbi:hypothetical protein T440DRAFT_512774 [Plenodomus tracheiphilus IPT5]|uniref:Uncharacterized protein n=1 Tax=Plenodomus tracheiphilus IPT5 TaxID=1408161 RepID=A0A6A7BPZ9_9PLEO|nr:hypothetical protein T440DRAFT_512774 [Plenodomus tracheiphilus IPT5]